MKYPRAALPLLLALTLVIATACASSPDPAPESGAAVPSSSISEPSSAEASASSEAEPAGEPVESVPTDEPEAAQASEGAEADLTAIITGEAVQEVPGMSGIRAGTAAERDSLMKLISSLKPENISLIVMSNPLSEYQDQSLLSDETARELVGLLASLPAPGIFAELPNPTTGGLYWRVYLETGEQSVSLSDDGSILLASLEGQTQSLAFDSTPCREVRDQLSAFYDAQISAAQENILTLS